MMKSNMVPTTNQKAIEAYMEKGVSSIVAVKLAKLREIELERRKIVDDRHNSKNGRQISEAKFRKYLEGQMLQ